MNESSFEENSMQIQSMRPGFGKIPPSTPPPAPQSFAVACQAAMPYPLIKPQCKNPRYAAAMLDNMSGQVSELSAVSLYFYNNLITSAYKEVAEIFHHISLVEMHHLEIFGNLALQLGENPRFWSRRGRNGSALYWSSSCLRYPPFPIPDPKPPKDETGCCPPEISEPSLKMLLAQAIESEEEALKKYMQQTTWIQDINICDNLRRIAADEQMHIDILTRLYHRY